MSRDLVPINQRDPFWKDPFFSSSWEDFDSMRQELLATNRDFWNNVDKDFEEFDDLVKKQHKDIDRQMAPLMPQLPPWAIPEKLRDKWVSLPADTEKDEVISVKESADKFEVTLDVSKYRPEELKVSTTNNILSVEGKHVEVREGSGSSSSVTKQFSRKWTLPEDCKVDLVASNLSSDGVLMVTAPRKNAITYTGASAYNKY